MRFCLVSTQEHWGGGEALLWSIAEELGQAGHAVSWIARQHSDVESRLEKQPSRILHRLKGRGTNLRDWRATLHALRDWVPDVVVLNDTHAVPLVGSAVWFCRHPRPLRLAFKHTVFPLRSGLKYRVLADRLICVSAAAQETVIRGGLAKEHSLVVHGGCTPPQPLPNARSIVRNELGLADGQRLLVCVGNLLDCKGHRELVAAARELAAIHPELVTVIAGEGVERANLEKQISESGLGAKFRLLGYRNDAEELLSAADLVVHPSHAEGLSLVLIQAQMLCKPLVATAVGGAAEVLEVKHPELCTSWIADARSPTSLAQQIQSAFSSIDSNPVTLQSRLEATAARTRENFDIRKNTTLLIEICARLLEERRSR